MTTPPDHQHGVRHRSGSLHLIGPGPLQGLPNVHPVPALLREVSRCPHRLRRYRLAKFVGPDFARHLPLLPRQLKHPPLRTPPVRKSPLLALMGLHLNPQGAQLANVQHRVTKPRALRLLQWHRATLRQAPAGFHYRHQVHGQSPRHRGASASG